MGIFNSNYSKPGPGIDKNAPKKKGLALFYEIFFRKFWKLIQLNLLYILTLIPTFAVVFILSGMISNKVGINTDLLVNGAGMALSEVDAAKISITMDLLTRLFISVAFTIFWGGGPATAGFVYILRSFVWEEPVFMASDFFGHIKSNFKQSLIVWIIDIIVFIVMCYAYYFYGSLPSIFFYLKYVILVLAFFYTMLHLFLYHLLVTYKLSIGQLYRNSALFALSSLPWCVLTIALAAFLILIFPAIGFTSQNQQLAVFFSTATFIILVLLIFAVCGLVIEFNTCMQVKKYIKEDADVERNE
ncbi:MAG: DUF624 domain-containing protein [Clostridia bacterium]|nr:DUF624 domain-containing protein [Clostridia bacterium]